MAGEEADPAAPGGEPLAVAMVGMLREVLGPHEDELKVHSLLRYLEQICNPDAQAIQQAEAMGRLSILMQPPLRAEVKHAFVPMAIRRGVVDVAVRLIEEGGAGVASCACDFLGDFAFNSDVASQAVLKAFDRIVAGFWRTSRVQGSPQQQYQPLLCSFVSLCANIVGNCSAARPSLIPLVEPVFLRIIRHPRGIPDRLLRGTILLLANLSVAVGPELRAMRAADALMELVLDPSSQGADKSVAESVIIFLLGHQQCGEIDQLLARDVIGSYCVPILECALDDRDFRGMYPHLVYSARLFWVLAQSRAYAERLVAHVEVVPLLLRAARRRDGRVPLSSDDEGRCLALDALSSLARFGLWPGAGEAAAGGASAAFVARDLPRLLDDEHAGVRAAAAAVWGRLHAPHVVLLLLIGRRLASEGQLYEQLWAQKVLTFLLPFLGRSDRPRHEGEGGEGALEHAWRAP